MERAVHCKREMSVKTKVSFGFLAQNEDNADQQHADWRLMATIKQIEMNQKLIDTKMKMMDTMVDGVSKTQFFMPITSLMDKVERLNEELAMIGNKKRSTNPIVDWVLLHAVESWG